MHTSENLEKQYPYETNMYTRGYIGVMAFSPKFLENNKGNYFIII